MRGLSLERPAEDNAQLVKTKPVDQRRRDSGPRRDMVCKCGAEGTYVLQQLNHQIDKLEFACRPVAHPRIRIGQGLAGENRPLVATQQLCRMLDFMTEASQQSGEFETSASGIFISACHSRPTTASIAFFIVAVVKGFLTRLFRPSFWPFWISSGVGVPVTRM